jgi:hypothetical protein
MRLTRDILSVLHRWGNFCIHKLYGSPIHLDVEDTKKSLQPGVVVRVLHSHYLYPGETGVVTGRWGPEDCWSVKLPTARYDFFYTEDALEVVD